MNHTLNAIKERRSTRKFKASPLAKDTLEAIIEAGLYAPSAHNQQSWHFTVIQDPDIIKDLNRATKQVLATIGDEGVKKMASKEDFDLFYGGPSLVLVSGEDEALMPEVDCAAATENMFIAAESLNVGGCWNGYVGRLFASDQGEVYKRKFGIPQGYTTYYAAVFGNIEGRAKNAPPRRPNRVTYVGV